MDFKTAQRLHRVNVMRRRLAIQQQKRQPAASVAEVGGLAVVALSAGLTADEAVEEAVKAAHAKKHTIQ
jgi:hypothetical protein